MKTLILSVDRDDDLGQKAGMTGPVIGRAAVLEAANRLALADPEDSDANCLFASVSTLDDLEREATKGRTYEIAAVTGHRQVGHKSDAILVSQVERVLAELRPDRLILVSDGAEDEHILPLLESRIKIDSVRRVVVKQAKNLEGAYYLFIRLFEDEKLQKKFVLPASVATIVFGFALALWGVQRAGGAGLITLGGFLLIHAMHWEARITKVFRDLYAGLKTGKVSFFTTVLAFALIGFGALEAFTDLHGDPDTTNHYILQAQDDALLFTLLFIQTALWWIIAGLILNILGRALDELIRFKSTKGMYWRLSFGLLALGFIMEGLLLAAVLWRGADPSLSLINILTDINVYSPVALGIVIALVGNFTYRYVRETMHEDEEEEPQDTEGDRIRVRRPGRRRASSLADSADGPPAHGHQEGG